MEVRCARAVLGTGGWDGHCLGHSSFSSISTSSTKGSLLLSHVGPEIVGAHPRVFRAIVMVHLSITCRLTGEETALTAHPCQSGCTQALLYNADILTWEHERESTELIDNVEEFGCLWLFGPIFSYLFSAHTRQA